MTANPRGGNYLAAGSYGREQRSTGCRRGNNPWGHPAGCSCRASQIVPYEPDVERMVDEYLERSQYRVDAEIDRQNGYEF